MITPESRIDRPASAATAASLRPTRTRYWVVVFAITLAIVQYIDRVCISQAAPDIVRDLHARSWARHGSPMVREYHEEYFPRIGIVLDTDSGAANREHLERDVLIDGTAHRRRRVRRAVEQHRVLPALFDEVEDLLKPVGGECDLIQGLRKDGYIGYRRAGDIA